MRCVPPDSASDLLEGRAGAKSDGDETSLVSAHECCNVLTIDSEQLIQESLEQ